MKGRLLLHACCGPCAAWPAPYLLGEWETKGLFFNPNIHPDDEYARRLDGTLRVFGASGISIVSVGRSDPEPWTAFSGDAASRCAMCYKTRLDATARYAREGGFDAFCTTLLISPYQKHDMIRQIGEDAAKANGIRFLYEDFRPRFREGQAAARSAGIYMQKYCGCAPSIAEASDSARARREMREKREKRGKAEFTKEEVL